MKFFTTRILGIIGIIGSPWAFIDFMNNGLYDRFVLTSMSGLRNFIFITGWTCSIIGLYKLQAMGNKLWQKIIMIIQIVLLCLANCWNIIEIFAPRSSSKIFDLLNLAWPIAGLWMLITGIVILFAKKLQGWKLYIPLFASFWFIVTTLIYFTGYVSSSFLIASGIYSMVAFSLLGFAVVITSKKTSTVNQPYYKA